jgi:cyclopropane fatty-acyl-phospholipid synthase-like methyltransferase
MTSNYDADYFLRGKETGKSLYHDYRWLPALTIPMAERIADFLEIELTDRIMDFGCSRGYLVKAFRTLGYWTRGHDISQWAIDNCDPEVVGLLSNNETSNCSLFDWIIAKDVLEHLGTADLLETLVKFSSVNKGVFIVVPLGEQAPSKSPATYVVPEYELDVTHVQRRTLGEWLTLIISAFGPDWEVSGRYRIQGIKDNWSQYPRGNGFITVRRI